MIQMIVTEWIILWRVYKEGGMGDLERGSDINKPVIAILADHLLVPSKTDWFTDIMWPTWLLSSTLNTSLFIGEIRFISVQ